MKKAKLKIKQLPSDQDSHSLFCQAAPQSVPVAVPPEAGPCRRLLPAHFSSFSVAIWMATQPLVLLPSRCHLQSCRRHTPPSRPLMKLVHRMGPSADPEVHFRDKGLSALGATDHCPLDQPFSQISTHLQN